jgi:3-amino-5-hydroxybenzoate synthase
MSTHRDKRALFEDRLPKWPVWSEQEEEAVLRVVRSGAWWREAGMEVESFEKEFAEFIGVDHVRAVTNGTQAIELALACLGLRADDEVIIPACTFISTASAVLSYGAVPIPVDVTRDTLCLDIGATEASITPRTRAVIPVHMAGHVCDMQELQVLSNRHGFAIVEDAAHAHGATWNGRSAGSIGDSSIFSFQAGKLITAGEGGAFATSDPDTANQTFVRHSCGRPSQDREYVHRVVASNLRMTELQGAILRVQLKRLPEQIAIRERSASHFDHLLSGIDGVNPLVRKPYADVHSHYMYMAWFDPEAFGDMTAGAIAKELRMLGVPAFRCFPPVHHTEMFSRDNLLHHKSLFSTGEPLHDYATFHTPVSQAAGYHVVWFHHSLLLSDQPILEEIADEIRKLERKLTPHSDE